MSPRDRRASRQSTRRRYRTRVQRSRKQTRSAVLRNRRRLAERGRTLWWVGFALMVATLPAALIITPGQAWTDDDDALLLVALTVGGPAMVGFPVMSVARLLRAIGADGDAAFPAGFSRARILRRPAGIGATMLTTCARLLLTVVAVMLLLVAVTYLITGEELSLENPVLGPVGDGILTAAIAAILAAAAWMVLGVAIAGSLLVGYAIVLLFLRDTDDDQLVTARMLLLAVLITIGIGMVVIGGDAGTPPDDRLVRGLITTSGAALIVVPMIGAMTWAWRSGHRPAQLDGAVGWIILTGRLAAAVLLVGWLIVSVSVAWS